jgi:3-oxoacid CoA-transferase subunit A
MINKVCKDANEATKDINNNKTIMIGGFGLCGNPENLITSLVKRDVQNLTIISNNCGTTKLGIGELIQRKQVDKVIASYVGENSEFEKQFLMGDLEVELTPQGTLAEKIRCGRAGIPGFYTRTGVNTLAMGGLPTKYTADGNILKTIAAKETKVFDNKTYMLETSLKADFALVKAYLCDTLGNLVFRKTAMNFNSVMCGAAAITIVEAEHIVRPGDINPDHIHVPGIYVTKIIQGLKYNNFIENLTISE